MIWKPLTRALIFGGVILGITLDDAWSAGTPWTKFLLWAGLTWSIIQLGVNSVRKLRGETD